MAISDSQKVDLLWKKIGYGRVKTDTNDNKKAPNESISSDFVIKTSQIWANSGSIPSIMPSANSSVQDVYLDSVSGALETTADATATAQRTWKTNVINWIAPGFGATYQLKVYAAPTGTANPQTNGSQLFETGSGNEDQWFFDYQAGVLHFIGDNLPGDISVASSNVIYVSGSVYTGTTGIDRDVSGASATYRKGNLADVYSDNTINDGDILEVTDAGDGEYAVYISKQDAPTAIGHLTLISSKDSSGSDSATMTATVTHTSGTVELGDVSSGSRPLSVVVNVTTAFDGTASVTIGDDNDNSRLMSSAYTDLTETSTFVTNPDYVYTNALDADNMLKVYVTQGTSTQGSATIVVSYS
jgi:hypothetical protein